MRDDICPYRECPSWNSLYANCCEVYAKGTNLRELCWSKTAVSYYQCTLCHNVFRVRKYLYYFQGKAPVCYRCAKKVKQEVVREEVVSKYL